MVYLGASVPPGRVPGVGSKRTQPDPWKYSSGQACMSWALYIVLVGALPGGAQKPTATRAGIPSSRAITAYAEANCWQ